MGADGYMVVVLCVIRSVRPSVCFSLSVRPERRSGSNSLGISAISLKFGVVMHSSMKQIATKMAMFGHLWRVQRKYEIFHDRFGRGPRENHSYQEMWGHHGLKFYAVMQLTVKQLMIWNRSRSADICIFWSRPTEGAVVLYTSCHLNPWKAGCLSNAKIITVQTLNEIWLCNSSKPNH